MQAETLVVLTNRRRPPSFDQDERSGIDAMLPRVEHELCHGHGAVEGQACVPGKRGARADRPWPSPSSLRSSASPCTVVASVRKIIAADWLPLALSGTDSARIARSVETCLYSAGRSSFRV
jgi:hypothetical protein